MQVVIEIPEEIYSHTQEYEVGGFNRENDTKLFVAIKNGIPLPKGHGDLIDRKELNVYLLHNWHGNNKNIVPYSDRKGYRLREREVEEVIINAPTIIEADKAESEEQG